MPNYVQKLLEQYCHNHNAPERKQDCPYQPTPRQCDHQLQILPQEYPDTPLYDERIQYIRHVVRSLLYYARAVNLTIHFALSKIARKSSQPH